MISLFFAVAVALAAPPEAPKLEADIASILPQPDEERWLGVPWRTNLEEARVESQKTGKPIFLWIMVGNPQGTT